VWRKLDITVVATSRWLADCARASSLFVNSRIETLPNCLDTTRYKPLDKLESRRAFNLPQHKRLILISADNATSDRRKGYHHLVDALRKLASERFGENAELIVVGASEPEADPGLGMKVNYLGRLHDDISQAILYSAADLLVAPSEQENLSNTVLESLACGTPVVAFNIGGMPDLISHQQNGYLAGPFDTDCLAHGITWVLGDPERHERLSRNARSQAESRHNPASVAGRYTGLYEQLVS
jgi:glycosyltransferase involved in cell wall biosynthesis